jgi:hypothetical protein
MGYPTAVPQGTVTDVPRGTEKSVIEASVEKVSSAADELMGKSMGNFKASNFYQQLQWLTNHFDSRWGYFPTTHEDEFKSFH